METNANPYIENENNPSLKTSVVVLIDVLGFQEMLRAAVQSDSEETLLGELRTAYNESVGMITDSSRFTFSEEKNMWEVKCFTDNIVAGEPIVREGEGELGMAIVRFAQFQLALACRGFFVRGAVAIGKHYMDSELVYGKALLEAHDAEVNLARDPRILLCGSVFKWLAVHISYYGYDAAKSPHYHTILRDQDGQYFVNYLDAVYDDPDNPRLDLLHAHQFAVTALLDTYANEPRIWSKYFWVANYHNFFCKQNAQDCKPFRIDMSHFKIVPKRISLMEIINRARKSVIG